ncbi:MAG TPA: hypothetical protein VK857_10500 [Desulforhopalus sp.]|nr:hypothetical protein [Desulforhopalus sp.]
MIRLLAVKGENGYYRFAEGVSEEVAVHRAKVFPLESEADARKALAEISRRGAAARLVLLTISEEAYIRGGDGDASGA